MVNFEIRFLHKILIALAVYNFGVILIFQIQPTSQIFGSILLGLISAHLLEVQHQCIHNMGFKNLKINNLFGIIIGMPLFSNFYHYQYDHFLHHKNLGTLNDKEFFDYAHNKDNALRMISFLDIFGLRNLFRLLIRFIRLFTLKPNFVKRHITNRNIVANYWYLLFYFILIIAFSVHLDQSIFLHLFVLPYFIGQILHFFIELPEHVGCEKSRNSFRNTNTIITNSFMVWLTNGNNYHAEHHIYPNLDLVGLKKAHSNMRSKLVHVYDGYWNFYMSLLRQKIKVRSHKAEAI
jgi:fatty acid desaturase